MHRQHNWLFCYDISLPSRLQRVHRILTQVAVPIQYSVFMFRGTDQERQALHARLDKVIDQKQDDLRCYQLKPPIRASHIGMAYLPDGLTLIGKEFDALQQLFASL